jgi:Ca2+-binding RTX toxin-like protein
MCEGKFMPRNPFWTATDASTVSFLLAFDDLSAIGFQESTSDLYEKDGDTSGRLSSSDTIDFVAVNLGTGSSYSFVATGSFQVDIEIFDSSGYLMSSLDADDIGLFDPYPTDSILAFTPDVSGIHYVFVAYENGNFSGSWTLLGSEDVGGDFQNSNNSTNTATTGTTVTGLAISSGTTADDNMFGASGGDEMWGGSGNDTIDSSAGSDVLYGNKGLDFLAGGDGDDTLFGGQNGGSLSGSPAAQRDGVETVSGGNGDDVIYGNHGADLLVGDDGNDSLFGGQDDDSLSGGAGSDSLLGNLGNDVFIGGDGADVFGVGNGFDTVNDFVIGDGDRLSVSSTRTSIRDVGTDAVVAFENGSSVTLVGVSSSSVTDTFFS